VPTQKCRKRDVKRGLCTTAISVAASTATASAGVPVTVGGSIAPPSYATPNSVPKKAVVQTKGKDGWHTVGTAELRPDGTFAFDVKMPHGKRSMRVRVVVPGIGRSTVMTIKRR
jgi:hypothetical protein